MLYVVGSNSIAPYISFLSLSKFICHLHFVTNAVMLCWENCTTLTKAKQNRQAADHCGAGAAVYKNSNEVSLWNKSAKIGKRMNRFPIFLLYEI